MGISKYIDSTAIDNALDKGVAAFDIVGDLQIVGLKPEAGSTLNIGGKAYTVGTNANKFNNIEDNIVIGDNSYASGNKTTAYGNNSQATGNSSNKALEHVDATAQNTAIISAWGTNKFSLAKGSASHAEGYNTLALGDQSHAEGYETRATGFSSHSEGVSTEAAGFSSHAEGNMAHATGKQSHAEGNSVQATGESSHAEGAGTIASGGCSHAEGNGAHAEGESSHAEGDRTEATGSQSHAEGAGTHATGERSHAEGNGTRATGNDAHAEGGGATASNNYAHAEGAGTTASGSSSHSEGAGTQAKGDSSHAEGGGTIASGEYAHAEGIAVCAVGNHSHAEGRNTYALGIKSHAEGSSSNAVLSVITDLSADTTNDAIISAWGSKKFALAKGEGSHTEGNDNLALGNGSHAGGFNNIASGYGAKADGCYTVASGDYSNTEGFHTTASGNQSTAIGNYTTASGNNSVAEGDGTTATGLNAHSCGAGTTAAGVDQFVVGKYNKLDNKDTYAFIVGNGDNVNVRNNAFTVDWHGNVTSGTGKSLSTNDYTNEDKNKLANLNNYDDSTLKTEIAVERSRINTFVALPEGSTVGDAELMDIRVATDGTTYDTAGDAVRGQINNIKSRIDFNDSDSNLWYTKGLYKNLMPLNLEQGSINTITAVRYDNDTTVRTVAPIQMNQKVYLKLNGLKYARVFYTYKNGEYTRVTSDANFLSEDRIIDTVNPEYYCDFIFRKQDESPFTADECNVELFKYSESEYFNSVIGLRNILNVNAEDIEPNGYYGYVGSEIKFVSNSNYMESGYIPVEKGDKIVMYYHGENKIPNLTVVFCNSNKAIVSGILRNDIITVPANISYIRVPIALAQKYNVAVYKSKDLTLADIPKTYHKYFDTISTALNELESHNTDEKTHWYRKTWYAYGTSLTNTSNEGKYAKYVEQFSGMTRINKGISGGGIVVSNANIKAAIMNTTDGKLNADLITLEVGANDTPAVLGTIYDTGSDTFCGALNQCIRYLQANTNAQIVVISSTQNRYIVNAPTDKTPPERKYGTDNHTKYDQWNAIRQVCALNGVYYIPMGESSGLGYARMEASNLYNVDQIHHTELGGYNLGQFVWSHLKNIPCWYSSIPNT